MKVAIVGEITPDEARKKAMALKLQISQGIDPLEVKQQFYHDPTFAQIAEEYMEKYAIIFKKEHSVANDKSHLKNHLLPYFGTKKITEIDRRHISKFHGTFRKTKYTGNRCVQLLSKIMNLCEEWGYRPENSNPCNKIQKYKEESRERFLNLEEIGRLQKGLDKLLEEGESPYFAALIRLLLLTGARLREIMQCKWEYINFDRKIIELPDSKTGKKNIILCDRCIKIITSLPKKPNNPFLIVSGRKKGGCLTDPKRGWHRLLKIANLEKFRIHDLRHTNASISIQSNIPLAIISKRLGHSSIKTTMKYAHLSDNQIREATDNLSDTLGIAMEI